MKTSKSLFTRSNNRRSFRPTRRGARWLMVRYAPSSGTFRSTSLKRVPCNSLALSLSVSLSSTDSLFHRQYFQSCLGGNGCQSRHAVSKLISIPLAAWVSPVHRGKIGTEITLFINIQRHAQLGRTIGIEDNVVYLSILYTGSLNTVASYYCKIDRGIRPFSGIPWESRVLCFRC